MLSGLGGMVAQGEHALLHWAGTGLSLCSCLQAPAHAEQQVTAGPQQQPWLTAQAITALTRASRCAGACRHGLGNRQCAGPPCCGWHPGQPQP